jgi:hypothetical protein
MAIGASSTIRIGAITAMAIAKIQQRRGAKNPGEIIQVADDRFRLMFAGYAIQISSSQPWTGSGSRSFGWKKNAAADPEKE